MYEVSGVITTYKREADIVERAIKSMLAQSFPLKEIVVVDDNKNDSAFSPKIEAVCNKYDTVKYVKQDGNRGACAARNLGIQNSSGELIGFLDDDDLWLPEKIAMQIKAFENGASSVGLVYCCGIQRNQETGEEEDYYNVSTFKPDASFNDLLGFDYIGSTSQPLIKRECFEKVGMFWEEQPARQDYEMWLRISKCYDIIGIPDKLFVHSVHNGEQISKGSVRSHAGYINIYKRYKKDYDKNPSAKAYLLGRILATRSSVNFWVIWFYCIRAITRLRINSKND